MLVVLLFRFGEKFGIFCNNYFFGFNYQISEFKGVDIKTKTCVRKRDVFEYNAIRHVRRGLC